MLSGAARRKKTRFTMVAISKESISRKRSLGIETITLYTQTKLHTYSRDMGSKVTMQHQKWVSALHHVNRKWFAHTKSAPFDYVFCYFFFLLHYNYRVRCTLDDFSRLGYLSWDHTERVSWAILKNEHSRSLKQHHTTHKRCWATIISREHLAS